MISNAIAIVNSKTVRNIERLVYIMEWPVVIGVCLIIAGIFIAGTALGTRGKALPIIIGIAVGAFGVYVIMNGEVAFQQVINFVNKLR